MSGADAKKETQNSDGKAVFEKVDDLSVKLETIEKFISRRFDEISFEINATSQQMDMAEEGIINRFSEVLEVVQAISFEGDGITPANTGVELNAVVEITEEATNKILDSAGVIMDKTEADIDWSDENARTEILRAIQDQINEIFMACSFQDLTGQRVRTTLENLNSIEDRLSTALDKMGVEIAKPTSSPIKEDLSNQTDIDALFDDD